MAEGGTDEPRIVIERDGPYAVHGRIPIRRIRPVMSEHGEPMTWEVTERFEPRDVLWLCRCGGSGRKPFCDGTHNATFFEGDESAPTSTYDERARTIEATGITVRDDRLLCEHAGFCGNRTASIWNLLDGPATEDSVVRAQVITMIERCPSGALTFRLSPGGPDVEPELPAAIGVVDDGPLFVSGNVRVERSDGEPFETRNRVTLCRCGASQRKPLCDGSHRGASFVDRGDD